MKNLWKKVVSVLKKGKLYLGVILSVAVYIVFRVIKAALGSKGQKWEKVRDFVASEKKAIDKELNEKLEASNDAKSEALDDNPFRGTGS